MPVARPSATAARSSTLQGYAAEEEREDWEQQSSPHARMEEQKNEKTLGPWWQRGAAEPTLAPVLSRLLLCDKNEPLFI